MKHIKRRHRRRARVTLRIGGMMVNVVTIKKGNEVSKGRDETGRHRRLFSSYIGESGEGLEG